MTTRIRPQSAAALLALSMLTPLAFAEPDLSATDALAATMAGKLRLIDIRTPDEWRQTGVAPGVARADFYRGPEALEQSILELVGGDRTAPIALICRTGNRTTQAQKFLQSRGFTQVYNIREGMAGSAAGPGWLRRGLPVESCMNC
ncbi:MAG: rhodanese-like domain-containing protein [Rhodocyclaceae bacterium]|jgi:rhodanese-related sulfurtransferase|nr:rhodanese-like domain-containing protein [Rhodocyclaceae bacterium]MCL4759411.1 rhodanese-like domain-containing protein [Rhodocyclaceae bacterium]